jgi:hypothetical protein
MYSWIFGIAVFLAVFLPLISGLLWSGVFVYFVPDRWIHLVVSIDYGRFHRRIKKMSNKACLRVIERRGDLLDVPHQFRTEELCWQALKMDIRSFDGISNPTPEMCEWVLENAFEQLPVAKYGADYSHILALLIQRAPTAGIAVQAILASWDIGMDRDS